MLKARLVLAMLFIFLVSAWGRADDLDNYIKNSQWNDAIQTAQELINRNPKNYQARLKGAYALFQKNYPNVALLYLKKIPVQEWKNLPQGRDKLVDIVLLFQKKVPLIYLPWRLDDISLDSGNYLSSELQYMKGREAIEQKDLKNAEKYLSQVGKNSRFFAPAQYLLGTLKINNSDYILASKYFSNIFEPAVLSQSTEFWKDVGSEMTSHWGANFQIQMSTDPLVQTQRLGELGMMALARIAYAQKDFQTALDRYNKVSPTSTLSPRATLEKIWCLLNLDKHKEAQELASQLITKGEHFQSIEASILKALILADSGQGQQAREQIESFNKLYLESKKQLLSGTQNLPAFLKEDLASDLRVQAILNHEKSLSLEIQHLRSEDQTFFPVFTKLAVELELLRNQSSKMLQRWTDEHISQRLKDLERLHIQSKLIAAETYLDDRENLKKEFKQASMEDKKMQGEYDNRLVELLQKAVDEVSDPLAKYQKSNLNLLFRQSEIVWELGTAKIIIGKDKEGEKLRRDAVKIIEEVAREKFVKKDQALFFLGFAYFEVGRVNEGVKTFLQYVHTYPKHIHVPDAYRILADKSFDENKFKEAEEFYKKVLQFPESPFVGYALYKLGWCGYNLKAYGRALLGLEEAYRWTKKTEQGKSSSSLQRESRRDLISIYTEVGDHKKAQEYFSGLDADVKPWLVELIKKLDEDGQFEKIQDLYATVIQLDPKSPDNMMFQAGIIQAAYKLQRWQVAEDNFDDLIKNYSLKLSAPSPQHEKVESILREVVSAHLNDFKSTNLQDAKERTIRLDEKYLSTFRSWPQSEPLLYRHAQYLLENNKLQQAQAAFEKHWVQFKELVKEPVREEGLRNLISVLGRIEDAEKNQKDKILTYTAEYEKLYPTSKYIRPILFLRASILLKYSMTEEGIKLNQKLYDQNPKDDIGKKAFKNLAKAYYDLKDWKRTYEWASKMKGASDLQTELQTIREESYFLWANNTKDDKEAAQLFMNITSDSTMSALHDKSLYNAFIHFQKLGESVEALKALEKLEAKNSNFAQLTKAAGVQASYYMDSGNYIKALPYLKKYVKGADGSTPKESLKQAEQNISLIEKALQESSLKHAPQPVPFLKGWSELVKERAQYEKFPLPAKGKDLVAQIREGGLRLQKISKKFLDIADSAKSPLYFSMEAYCTTPFLYARYSSAIRGLKQNDVELNAELEKVALPLDQKADEFVKGCIERSEQTQHMGPVFNEVTERWGWQKDEKLKAKAKAVIAEFEKQFPLIEAPIKEKEEVLMAKLLATGGRKKEDVPTWAELAKLRLDQKKYGLARLTYTDTLSKFKDQPVLLNGYAVIEHKFGLQDGLLELFEQAGKNGSGFGWANAGFLHLKELRFDNAKNDFKKALSERGFEGYPSLEQKVKELLEK